jgi:polysaccharide biosynthesis transport protein
MLEEMQDQQTRSVGDYLAIVRRHRWVILISTFVCWLLVWAIGWLVPLRYESDAVVAVRQQQVSPKLVEPNSFENAQAQLDSVRAQVLNPTSLQGIIDQDNLYAKHSGLLSLLDSSDSVEQMQKDIKVIPIGADQNSNPNQTTVTDFQISYTANSPALAQQIARELQQRFINQNNQDQKLFSNSTTEYLKVQLQDAQDDLNQQDAKVKAFKAANAGELPDEVQSNLQILNGLQQELQNNESALSGARQQRLYLESIVQQYQSAEADLGTADSSVSPSSLDKQLKDLQLALAQEKSQYTDKYPDVIALEDQIEKTKELQKQAEKEVASTDHKADKSGDILPAATAVEVQNGSPTPMMQIESQLKSNQLQLQGLETAQKGIIRQIDEYQARLNAAPKVDQELGEITRGYAEAETNYNSLLQRVQDSQLAQNLPNGQAGEYWSVGEATLPTSPSEPLHLLISLGGLAGGIAVGLGLAVLFEFADVRIRKESDLDGVVSARVLVGIPKMTTGTEQRRHAMLRWAERGAVFAMFVVIVAGNIYSFYKG